MTSTPAAAGSPASAPDASGSIDGERRVPRRQVFGWAIWDWSAQPFNTVVQTFIFVALYLTSDVFLPDDVRALGEGDPVYERGLADLATTLGVAGFVGGLLIALLAPVLGRQSDASGRRKFWLMGYTYLLVLSMAALWFVEGQASFFLLGVVLVTAGTVFSEIAAVNANAMLLQVSNRRTIGRTSGLGWGLGYIGGILALVVVVVFYARDWFGIPDENGLPFRIIAVGCAVWTLLFSLPTLFLLPEHKPVHAPPKVGFFAAYVALGRDVARLWREERGVFSFLVASAVYRDGLAGVFTFGAVIAAQVFGFGFIQTVIFGIAANLIAGVATILSGRLDDRFGPRALIVVSLVGLLVAGVAVFALRDLGTTVFWVGGLLLCCFVGPAQAASRSFLGRLAPAGREGELFGLYATTGRAASFIAPGLWALAIAIFGSTAFGILGIMVVLAAGLVLMRWVPAPTK